MERVYKHYYYIIRGGKYRADIGFKGKRYYLGSFSDYEEAVAARMEAEKKIQRGFLDAYYEWKERADRDPEWGKDNPLVFEVEKKDGGLFINRQST